jgi:IMP and pyridine-specific 5'-nucleotidase
MHCRACRLSGLLEMMKQAKLGPEAMGRFYVLGGECNYLFRCTPGVNEAAPG